ncbi:tetratricopeptide repeat protein [Muricoccus radiodurans]|uniref:alpha/beta fold hydrolase n=1 Tax=Muricoccus radiodurans TaxID=2231721 RepID=UPI003CF155E5
MSTEHFRLDVVEGAKDLLMIGPGLTEGRVRDIYLRKANDPAASRLVYGFDADVWRAGGVAALLADLPRMAEEVLSLARQAGAERIFAYGHSFGGFGALALGLLVGAERIVVTSAETRLNDPYGRGALMLRGAAAEGPHVDLREVALRLPPREVHLIFGERDWSDTGSALHMADVPNVSLHPVRGADHRIGALLKPSRSISHLLRSVLKPRFDPETFMGPPAPALPLAVGRALQSGRRALAAGDGDVAETAFREITAMIPDALIGWHALAIGFVKHRQPAKALEALEVALSLDPENPYLFRTAAQAHQLAGRVREAQAACQRGLAVLPTDSGLLRLRATLRVAPAARSAAPVPSEPAA